MALAVAAVAQTAPRTPPRDLARIEHIVVIYLENHSFDNLFGKFPGADGLARAGKRSIQVGRDGQPYKTLPPVLDPAKNPPQPDPRFPAELPNGPFPIDKYVSLDAKTPDLVHRFYQQQLQIDGGKMDKFVAYTNAGGLVMGYQDGGKLALWKYAQQFTLADHFFHAALGGSFLNHFWTVCAC
ncbi:MAG TPA: alkaline phosphatase family protein, partial [Stellaceae bacterium]